MKIISYCYDTIKQSEILPTELFLSLNVLFIGNYILPVWFHTKRMLAWWVNCSSNLDVSVKF